MNSTSFIKSEILIQNLTITTTTEPWFIPLDIFMILCSILVIILATLYLFTIILDRTCHTILMLLVSNSCLTALIVGCTTLSMSVFTFQNDLKQVQYQDSLCILRAYIGYASYGILNFSFFLQALYRYFLVLYPTRLFYKSIRFQGLAILITWIIGFLYLLLFVFTGNIIYNNDDKICQLLLQLSFAVIYGAFCAYTIPLSLIMLIYFKLVRYVKQMNKNVTATNSLVRAQRELKMVRRTFLLITILVALAFPYILIMFISFFTGPPKYHFRIAYIFFDASTLSVMFSLFQFTDPLKASLKRRIHLQPNIVGSLAT